MILEDYIDCRIQDSPLDVIGFRRALPKTPEAGGYVCFEGHVRSTNEGKNVLRLEYQVYEVLALKELHRIANAVASDLSLKFVRCVHRSGTLEIGEPAVLIQVLAPHRGEAFAGCRRLIDEIKTRVPIWKKEYYDDGSANWTQCHNHG